MTDLAQIKQRIKALAEKTVGNGCTEAEALAAAAMVDRLLERHALTMDEVSLHRQACVTVEVPFRGRRAKPIDRCIPAIALFCDCKSWLSHRGVGGVYAFFGLDADTIAARYLLAVIDAAMRIEAARYRWQDPQLKGRALPLAMRSFQHGMAARMAGRLTQMHAERESTIGAHGDRGTALVVAKHSMVDAAFSQTNMRLTPIRTKPSPILESAFRAGEVAAEGVDLRRIGPDGKGEAGC